MRNYLNLLKDILENGEEREDRTGVGTISVFGRQARFNLKDGLPAVTTKRLFFKGIIRELLWIISGNTNIAELEKHGVKIWSEWADEFGNLGPVYGHQLRAFGENHETNECVDQLAQVIESIKTNPNSRRHLITLWNPSAIPLMRLPPCHGVVIQFYVRNSGHLDCMMYQRSCDAFLGVPFNITSYAILTSMIAQVCGLKPGEFIHTYGDLHIYKNHIERA